MSLAKRRRRSIRVRRDDLPSVVELNDMCRFADIGFQGVRSQRAWLLIYLQVCEILLKKISLRLNVRISKSHSLLSLYNQMALSRHGESFYAFAERGVSSEVVQLVLNYDFVATRYIDSLYNLKVIAPLKLVQKVTRNLFSVANKLRIY